MYFTFRQISIQQYTSEILLCLIFIFGIVIRFIYISPDNTIIGFDQARDLYDSTTIFRDFNLRIIGPTAGNNPNLHHGILYLYYIAPPLAFFSGNPTWVAIYNSFINCLAVIVLYFLSKKLFKNDTAAIMTAVVTAVSYYFVQYSGWLSNPTVTLFTVPLFFLGLWSYYLKEKWGLIVAAIGLGLSIQFELFFIYLIPISIILWLILKLPFNDFKTFFFALITLGITTSTMILTEIKFQFGTIKSILFAGSKVGGAESNFYSNLTNFTQRYIDSFSLNLFPNYLNLGIIVVCIVFAVLIFEIVINRRNKEVFRRNLFVLIYLVSPAIMLILGYHNVPWFLIGLPPAIALASGYVISKIKNSFVIIFIVGFIVFNNTSLLLEDIPYRLLEPDQAALLSDQLKAIDYTYEESQNDAFTINTLTNPLYVNAIWDYHYSWYGLNKYRYLPTWGGGEQLYPYNNLKLITNREKFLYLIIDNSPRIPISHKLTLINWADERSELVEEKTFGGIIVQKRLLNRK